ncbi:MAG: DUF2059 domain-containing protein [Hyphomicrobiales bacterium]|nr:DUF2059 domain-containing protein [Hyphomicrobiales bacterium]
MTSKNLLRAAGIAFALVAAPALAQNAAPAPATPAAPAAPAAEPTPAQIALGREVLTASGVAKSFDIAVPQMLDSIGTRVTQTRPDLIRDLNAVMEQIKPEFDKRVDTLIDQGARAYAKRFSEDELKQIASFFKSSTGAKYVASQPAILNDLFVAFQAWQQQISGDMMARVREEMKKKGHEL